MSKLLKKLRLLSLKDLHIYLNVYHTKISKTGDEYDNLITNHYISRT